eukprot:g3409.t1
MGLAGSSCCQEEDVEEPKEVLQACSHREEAEEAEAQKTEASAGASDSPSPSRHPSKASIVQRIGNFQVDTELLRGISLQRALWHGGALFRQSPVDLPDGRRMGLWERGRQVEGFDIFLSHTWQTPGIWKAIALLVHSVWPYALLFWSLSAALAMLLCAYEVLPVVPKKLADAPVVAFAKFEELNWEERRHGPRGAMDLSPPWVTIFGFFSWLALGLYAYLPSLRSDICFLDVVSIHQTDPVLMERGIYGLAGFLRMSKELRVLWSPRYLSRLWCVFELAAFRTCNPSGKITFTPLFIELSVFWMVFAGYIASSVYWVTIITPSTIMTLVGYMCGLAPCTAAIHQLRLSKRMQLEMFHELATFDLTKAESSTSGFTKCYTPLFLTGFVSVGLDTLLLLRAAQASPLEITCYVFGPLITFHVAPGLFCLMGYVAALFVRARHLMAMGAAGDADAMTSANAVSGHEVTELSGAVPAEMAVPAEIAVAVFGTHATLSLEPVDMLGRAQRTPGPVVLEASARGRRGGQSDGADGWTWTLALKDPFAYPWEMMSQHLTQVPLARYALLLCTEPVAGCLMLRRLSLQMGQPLPMLGLLAPDAPPES